MGQATTIPTDVSEAMESTDPDPQQALYQKLHSQSVRGSPWNMYARPRKGNTQLTELSYAITLIKLTELDVRKQQFEALF